MTFLDRIPNWLRWVLFLPASILASIIVYAIVILGNKLTMIGIGEGLLERIVFMIIANGASAASFVWVGTTIAPRKHFVVSVILAIIYGLMLVGILIWMIYLHRVFLPIPITSWLEIIIACIAGGIAIVVAVIYFYEKESNKRVS